MHIKSYEQHHVFSEASHVMLFAPGNTSKQEMLTQHAIQQLASGIGGCRRDASHIPSQPQARI